MKVNIYKPYFHRRPKLLLEGNSCIGYCCSRIDGLKVEIEGRVIVDTLNLHLHCGELLAVVGPNGGGKSTLLKALIGEIPSQGSIEFLESAGVVHPKPRIGYVPQNLRFEQGAPLTVLDFFASALSKRPLWLGVSKKFRTKALALLKEVEACELIDRKISVLSGGELQRVLLALALEPMPNLLLLDEPISGMDANGRKRFYELVDRLRKTFDLSVLLISHDFGDVVQFADRLMLLDGKMLAIGRPKEVMQSPAFKALFSGVLE